MTPSSTRTRAPKLDAVSASAVELAATALVEVAEPGQVGEHVRVEASGERLVTHVFEARIPGYQGWYWIATLARAPRAKVPTVCETALVPGDDALLAPEWEPWAERLRPGDVGADDVLPYKEYDERLEQGYESTEDAEADRVAEWELGLGRPRVLSKEGREGAATRWMDGDFGPRELSRRKRKGTVQAHCMSCGFLSLLSGSLRQEFGICTNEWSPADGRVVSLQYGCGAHSETDAENSTNATELPPKVLDEEAVDYEDRFEEKSIIDEALLQKEIEKAAAAKAEGAEAEDAAAVAAPEAKKAAAEEAAEAENSSDEDTATEKAAAPEVSEEPEAFKETEESEASEDA